MLTGQIDVSGVAGKDAVITDQKLIPYVHHEGDRPSKPLSVVITQFHILVLFQDRYVALILVRDHERMHAALQLRIITFVKTWLVVILTG